MLAANPAYPDDLTPLGCSPCDPTIACFEPYDFVDSGGRSHRIYVAGVGPPVLLLHELPGLTSADISLAKRLTAEGFTVLLPLLFGKPGDNRTFHNLLDECGRSKFDCNGSGRTPHPVQWIREFCAHVAHRWSSPRGMGAIGMCLTGAFPLAILEVKNVTAPVLCQPTSPSGLLSFLRFTGNSPNIGIATADLNHARDDSQVPILAIRYAGDWRCPNGRFNALSKRFTDRLHLSALTSHASPTRKFALSSASASSIPTNTFPCAPGPMLSTRPRSATPAVSFPSHS